MTVRDHGGSSPVGVSGDFANEVVLFGIVWYRLVLLLYGIVECCNCMVFYGIELLIFPFS